MNYIQNIDWYNNKYLEKDFIEKEYPHYLFHFEKGTLANQDIDQIIELKESHYNRIMKWLDVNNTRKIDYYIYPNIKEKIGLMGDDSPGNVIWEELTIDEKGDRARKFEIHVVYNERCKFIGEHEDAHLLSLPWGLSIYLFCEGLAQFMEDSFMGQELHEVTKKLKEENKLYSIEFLCSNDNWKDVEPIVIYPQVGSFVKFLINKYSRERFKAAYQDTSRHYGLSKNLEQIKKVYNKSISELESEWLKHIN